MTPHEPSAVPLAPVHDLDPEASGEHAPTPADGVMGDVFVTVLLAAALAALVGTVLFLLWRALPGALAFAAVLARN